MLQTQTKPTIRSISRESDLAEVLVGDLVKVSVRSDPSAATWMVYGGNIDGKDHFLEHNSECVGELVGWKSDRRYLQFATADPINRGTGAVLLPHLHRDLEVYDIKHPQYYDKLKLLEAAQI